MGQYIKVLKQRNFILVFLGQAISNLGNGINTLGLTWFILNANGNVSDLGLLMITIFLPNFILGPIAGTIVDRMNKKHAVVIGDIVSGLLSLLLISATELWMVYVLVFGLNSVRVFFNPAMRSLLPGILEKEYLLEANALFSISHRISMLLGPTLGGVLVALVGVKGVFLLNGVSFVLSALSEAFICSSTSKKVAKNKQSLIADINDSMIYIKANKAIKFVIIFFILISITGGSWSILSKAYLTIEAKVTVYSFGVYSSLLGVGSLLGALILGKIGRRVNPIKMMLFAAIFYPLAYGGLGFSINPVWLGICFIVAGVTSSLINVSYDIYLQSNVDKDMLGRVFSLDMAFSGVIMLVSAQVTTVIGNHILPSVLLITYAGVSILIGAACTAYYCKHEQLINKSTTKDENKPAA